LIVVLIVLITFQSLNILASSKYAVIIHIEGVIDKGLEYMVSQALSNAEPGDVVILVINSYGGYLYYADKIIEAVRERAGGCIAWVDSGYKAVSAAAYIALSCKRIYMGPGSVLGGVKPSPFDEKVVSYVENRLLSFLAEKVNVTDQIRDIVHRMVYNGESFTVDELAELGLVIKANSLSEVYEMEGVRNVKAIYKPGLIESILSTITNPTISTLLVLMGGLLILIEIFTTGFQGYAIPGIVMLVLGLYGLYLFPPDLVVLTFLVMGVVLLGIEMFTPGFGLMGISGIILLLIGVIAGVMRTPPEARTASLYAGLIGILAFSGFMLFVLYKAIEAARMKKPSLSEKLIGQIGVVKSTVSESNPGTVYVLNEDWTAYSVKGVLEPGRRVRVVKVDGLKLYVEPVD